MLAEEIIREAKENAKAVVKRAEAIAKLESEKLEKELKELEEKRVKEKEAELKEREKEFKASVELEKKRILQEAKETLFKKFLEELSEVALSSPSFWKALAKKAKDVVKSFPAEKFTVYVSKGKKRYFSGIPNVKESTAVLGFKVVSEDGSIEYDGTIEEILKENRSRLKKLFSSYFGG